MGVDITIDQLTREPVALCEEVHADLSRLSQCRAVGLAVLMAPNPAAAEFFRGGAHLSPGECSSAGWMALEPYAAGRTLHINGGRETY
ncbi:hypothetical protein ACWEWX_44770 [Streptomyces asiaticus]